MFPYLITNIQSTSSNQRHKWLKIRGEMKICLCISWQEQMVSRQQNEMAAYIQQKITEIHSKAKFTETTSSSFFWGPNPRYCRYFLLGVQTLAGAIEIRLLIILKRLFIDSFQRRQKLSYLMPKYSYNKFNKNINTIL